MEIGSIIMKKGKRTWYHDKYWQTNYMSQIRQYQNGKMEWLVRKLIFCQQLQKYLG